jgi:cation diffusion facilitator CzcD-associated flavoprotein CzcO
MFTADSEQHVIQATGHSGEPNFPFHLKGLDTFAGTRLVHSSKFTGAVPSHGKNKRAIIVGCCNSGHDIAQDFYENGYNVTMIQR